MKVSLSNVSICVLVIFSAILLPSFKNENSKGKPVIHFPYKQAGLTEEQAAAHLLNRFSFGALPGQVEAVQKMGLENWFLSQLEADAPDTEMQALLLPYPLMKLSTQEIISICPEPARVLKMAIDEGIIDKNDLASGNENIRKKYRTQLQVFMEKKGFISRQELIRQLINQKIVRALASENQLQEVLTNFWFNHFNVSLTKNESARFVPGYERDVIRPNVLGNFETLLLATAKSPAMLTYLDNFRSSVSNSNATAQQQMSNQRAMQMLEQTGMMAEKEKAEVIEKVKNAKKQQGLNENYAREIMELHTLGVDGGYTQTDVTQAARVLTGWTIYPMEGMGGAGAEKIIDRFGKERLQRMGFVEDGTFLFNANRHDKSAKTVLGVNFPSGGGYEEGTKLIHLLATHPNTAKFISRKLAVHFVNDHPSQSLVDKMTEAYKKSDGDIKQVLIAMATAPEFWSSEAVREKTKSPLELAISSLRSLDAEVKAPYMIYNWISKMGENLYYYQAPTGFPDRGEYWINTGSLLYRMNFGMALATQRIPGVSFNLAALNHNKEPESPEAALATYGKLMMPGRDMTETISRLQPMLNDPELASKIQTALQKKAPPSVPANNDLLAGSSGEMMMESIEPGDDKKPREKAGKNPAGKKNMDVARMMQQPGNNTVLANVVGILIGSPEFQRR